MAARRTLEWIRMFKSQAGFRYEMSDLFVYAQLLCMRKSSSISDEKCAITVYEKKNGWNSRVGKSIMVEEFAFNFPEQLALCE